MKTFGLMIDLGNDAMTTPDDIARALRAVANQLTDGTQAGKIRDDNGNTVGRFATE